VAIIVLFILQFTGRNANMKQSATGEAATDSIDYHLPIAYIRTDSLLLKYKFYNDLSEAYVKKFEDKKLIINQRTEKFRKEVTDFSQKAQMNAFISDERRMQEENRLAGIQRDLENYQVQVERELSIEQENMHRQLQDTIISALKQFNIPKKYEIILSNAGTDNILYADESYNITEDIIEYLNARYVPQKK
jgi:outer membrane protein